MHGIGNEQDAQTILRWVRDSEDRYGMPTRAMKGEAPEGWEYVGRGSYRSVWLSPDGVAYKVDHDRSWSCQSETEAMNLKIAWEKGVPEGCRLPRFDRFEIGNDFIVAMELIRGDLLYDHHTEVGPFGSYHTLLRKIERKFRLCDMHDRNAIVDEDGYLVPVDFGG